MGPITRFVLYLLGWRAFKGRDSKGRDYECWSNMGIRRYFSWIESVPPAYFFVGYEKLANGTVIRPVIKNKG